MNVQIDHYPKNKKSPEHWDIGCGDKILAVVYDLDFLLCIEKALTVKERDGEEIAN